MATINKLTSQFAAKLQLDGNQNEIQDNPNENLVNLLNHILLPRFTTIKSIAEWNLQDETLLEWMSQTMASSADWLPSHTIAMFESFKRVHEFRDDDETICRELNKLRPGETFAMYVRRQNTVFMCYMPADAANGYEINEATEVIVATFPGQVNAKDIYAHPLNLEVAN